VADHKTLDDDVNDRLGADAALRVAMLSLEHCSDGIYWFDSDARVVYANHAACRALGYSMQELVGLLVTDLNPTYPADASRWKESLAAGPEDAASQLPPWLRALHERTASQTYETVHRRRDGSLLSVEVTATPIDIGGRRFIVAAVRDVSARRWMESAVRNIAGEVDKCFEVTFEMLCITDQRGVFRRLNPSWQRVLGYTPEELTGRPLFDLVHLDDRGLTLEAFKQLGSQASVVTFANRFERKAGGHCHGREIHEVHEICVAPKRAVELDGFRLLFVDLIFLNSDRNHHLRWCQLGPSNRWRGFGRIKLLGDMPQLRSSEPDIFAARAVPAPNDRPCPSEPVEKSMPGS